jgi:HEPN domain-containing protein
MTNDEKVQYWIDLSDEDVKTAEVMLNGKRYLYVGFMCHQVIEKIFKAAYAKQKEETPPFTHGLRYLAEKGNFWERCSDEQQKFIIRLDPFNVRARYPDYKNSLAKELTDTVCTELLEQSKILQQWIKEQILSKK